MEIHYNERHHELTPRGEGASEGCRPKLPRSPFSTLGTPVVWSRLDKGIVGEPGIESKLFLCDARIWVAP